MDIPNFPIAPSVDSAQPDPYQQSSPPTSEPSASMKMTLGLNSDEKKVFDEGMTAIIVPVVIVIVLYGYIRVSSAAIAKLASKYQKTGIAIALLVIFGIFPFPMPIPTLILASIIVHKANKKEKKIFGMKRN